MSRAVTCAAIDSGGWKGIMEGLRSLYSKCWDYVELNYTQNYLYVSFVTGSAYDGLLTMVLIWVLN